MRANGEEALPVLAVFDIGNTKTGIGIYADGRWVADWRVTTHLDFLADEYAVLFKALLAEKGLAFGDIDGAVLASVVPPLTGVLAEMLERYVGERPLVVGAPGVETGVRIRTENPAEPGADRIANTVAVHRLYGGPAIVIDLGTATTFDVVSREGDYLGGAIAPGLGIAADALVRRTARLPKVELAPPAAAIGKNTVTAMQSGLVFGYLGLVKELIARLRAEIDGTPKIVATGGMAEMLAEWTEVIDEVARNLTLEGIRLIYEQNRKG